MDGVQQRPFMVERDVPVLELFLDGAETPYHNILSFVGRELPREGFRLFPVISPRSNHRSVPFVRLRIAYQYNGKHIRLFGVERFQRRYVHFLFGTSRLAHISYGRLR